MTGKMYSHSLGSGCWWNRAISPLDFSDRRNMRRTVVVVHPGWGKRPEIHGALLRELASAGFMPIGVDTRFGNAPSAIRKFFGVEPMRANRYYLRRPAGLAVILDELGVRRASLIGHSEGGRVVTVFASKATKFNVEALVAVNAIGTGVLQSKASQLLKSNLASKELIKGSVDVVQGIRSALEMSVYVLLHPLRVYHERRELHRADIRPLFGKLSGQGVQVYRVHAVDDVIVEPENSYGSKRRPKVQHIATRGGHSNVYAPGMRRLLIDTVLQAKATAERKHRLSRVTK